MKEKLLIRALHCIFRILDQNNDHVIEFGGFYIKETTVKDEFVNLPRVLIIVKQIKKEV